MTESKQTQEGREELDPNRLSWDAIPLTTRADIIPFLQVESCLSLDLSMTNHEARPHLVRSYKDMRSRAFDGYLYTEKDGFGALRWVMQRGIDLRGFRLEVGGRRGSGGILYELMRDEEVEIAEYYVTRGELHDVDEAVYEGGSTALVSAASRGHLTIVKGLLDAGADMDKADDDGNTPLYGAAREGRAEVVQALVDAGADKDKANNDGWTPLHGAAWKGHTKVVQALVDAGADLTKKTHEGKTALDIAKEKGRQEIALLLEQAGAS